MAVKIAPTARRQFEDANGVPYAGGKLFYYAAGSSTKQATYTDSVGGTANTNPIILDSAGRTPYGVWFTAGLNYKEVLALSTDTDPPGSPIYTEDNISGTNDTTTTVSQWTASAATPTYISATTFSLAGDKTADFHVGRRLKFTVTAGTVYGLITVTAYTTLTTVTVVLDSGSLDSGLSAVELSILTSTGSSLPGQLKTLAPITATQATDLASLSTFMGTVLNDADAATALKTLGASLNTVTAKSSAYTVIATDRGVLLDCTGTFTLTLTAAATLANGFVFGLRNSGTGVITIDPNAAELIDGAATVTLGAGDSCLVVCDGAAWKTVGRTNGLGAAQTWQAVTRAAATTYTNTTGRPIFFSATVAPSSTTVLTVDGVGVSRPASDGTTNIPFSAVIPAGKTYSYTGTLTPPDTAYELR